MRRLLFLGRDRTANSVLRFFVDFDKDRCPLLKCVCTDIWPPYLKVFKKKATGALHILDRFHLVAHLNKALNEIRAQEARRLRREGYEEILKNTPISFHTDPDSLTPNERLILGLS